MKAGVNRRFTPQCRRPARSDVEMTKRTRPRESDPVAWLLEEDNPSVRYFALTRIRGLSEQHRDVRQARQRIMESGAVPAILDRQQPGGFWEKPDSFYTAKYRGTVWQLMILAEHAADGTDPRVRRACEFMLERSQDRSSGGFAMHSAERIGGGRPSEVIPCLSGNMVWSLLRLGCSADERVRRGIDWLAQFLRFDDGDSEPPQDWPYRRWEICYGRHSCFMGVVKGLKALAEIPEADRTPKVKRCVRAGAEFLLRHHLYKRSHNLNRISKPGLNKLGFPRMWQTDVLEILQVLFRLGLHDARMQEATDLVAAAQGEDGRWRLQDSFNGKFQVNTEAKGKPSKWITLNALSVLRSFRG